MIGLLGLGLLALTGEGSSPPPATTGVARQPAWRPNGSGWAPPTARFGWLAAFGGVRARGVRRSRSSGSALALLGLEAAPAARAGVLPRAGQARLGGADHGQADPPPPLVPRCRRRKMTV